MSSTASSDATFDGGLAGLEIVRHARARRCTLSVDPATGRTRLVLPPRTALKTALAWANGKAEWIDAQRARLPQPIPFVPGTALPVADRLVTIAREPGARRALRHDGNTLYAAGPEETIARRVEAWLRTSALAVLSDDTAYYAARAGVSVASVAVGDPRRRWGSCTANGTIRYSWRLLLAPIYVRRATAAHEVAHRVHMHHGPDFHTLVAQLFEEDPTPARRWLRTYGATLHWYGRSSV